MPSPRPRSARSNSSGPSGRRGRSLAYLATVAGCVASRRYSATFFSCTCTQPEQHRGVGIALDVGERVVLAVHGDPLAGPDAGGDPGQDTEREAARGAERERSMRQRPVQVDGGGDVGDQGDGEPDADGNEQREQHVADPSTPYLLVGREPTGYAAANGHGS